MDERRLIDNFRACKSCVKLGRAKRDDRSWHGSQSAGSSVTY